MRGLLLVVDPGVLMATASLIKLHGVLSLVVLLNKYNNYEPSWISIALELIPLTAEDIRAFLGISKRRGLAFSGLTMEFSGERAENNAMRGPDLQTEATEQKQGIINICICHNVMPEIWNPTHPSAHKWTI